MYRLFCWRMMTDMGANEFTLRLPGKLYRQVKQTARLAHCDTQDVIVSALEATLPPMPDALAPGLATDLARLMLLDDEALRAIAEAFLPPKRQRRFTTLLRKEQQGKLTAREKDEWQALKETYLRLSKNKAKAHFILEQRVKSRQQKED